LVIFLFFILETIIMTKNTVTPPSPEVVALMNALRGHTPSLSAIPDYIANSFNLGGRIAAAFTAASDNATDSFKLERERQLQRRAERLLDLASKGVDLACITA
jgi:hypothetical protein